MREESGGLSNSMGRKANQRANGENARFAVLFSNRLSLSRLSRTRKYKFQPSAIHVWLRSYATYFRYFRREFRSFVSRLCLISRFFAAFIYKIFLRALLVE